MKISNTNQKQLYIIRNLKHLFEESNIRFWLIGGWGIDFLAGRITREHEDIDIIINQNDYFRALELLRYNFSITEYIEFTKIKVLIKNIKLDICFYVEHSDELFIDLDRKDENFYPTPYDSFPLEFQKLHNLTCRTVSWSAQYVAKEGYYYFCKNKKRAKDISDLKIICENIIDLQMLNVYFTGVAKPKDMYQ